MNLSKKILSPFINPFTGPIFVITIILTVSMVFIIPKYTNANNKTQMEEKALELIDNLKKTRAYYTEKIISKIKGHENININFDHETNTKTIPLPATLLHDLSLLLPKNEIEIKMYSNYPFPNRENRVLKEHEKMTLSYLVNNPSEIYTQEISSNSTKKYKVAIADVFTDMSCVNCHNTRADTPKNNWKLGDVRGVIEVSMPYRNEFILTTQQTLIMVSILIFFILILAIHYNIISEKNEKQHKEAKETLESEVENRTQDLRNANKLLNQYKRAVDLSAIVSKTDKNGKITYVNDAFIKISKYTQEELIGENHNIVRHPDMPTSLFEEVWNTILSKQIWKGQIKNKDKEGKDYYVNTTIVPILNYENEIEEFLAIRLDITDVIISQIKAQKADEAKSTFLANMSHEIRTPLNAIIGFSDILCKSKSLDIHGVKQARIIQSSANSLLSIINDILDISKIESGNFDITIDNTDLYFISEHVIELFSKNAIEKNLKLIFNIDHRIPMCILTDGVRVRQVLSNLLSNAIKFTPQHGKVELNISLQSISDGKATINFEIKDTGIGIPDDKLDNVFRPFIQVDHKSTREFEGTGLGLSICSHIIEALGSKIGIKSSIGLGTSFFFDLTFDVCDDSIHTNKEYLHHLNFKVENTDNDLYHYIKRYLSIFGTININKSSSKDIYIFNYNKDHNLDDFRQLHKDNPILILFEYEEDLSKLILEDNEQALSLPFYASKVNDALQELQKKAVDSMPSINEDSLLESFNGNILVAEDNLANQELISYILESFGLNYNIKPNGKETLDEFISKPEAYDLVLMDINMPIMDGIEAFNAIREHEKQHALGTIPIIALTANAIKGDRERFLNIGMNEYLSKPVNTNELKFLFDKFLNKKEAMHSKPSLEESNLSKKEVVETFEIDIDKVISKLGVSKNIAIMIIEKFKKEIHKDLDELHSFIQDNDHENISAKAHYIKNSCLNLALDDICLNLQSLENSMDLSVNEINDCFNYIRKQLSSIKA
ncbi:ATP-binding protein [Arcobacter roscoffensis]|uniref:histidine kinase n=1 Tax=Arcobacter roscoffensis TaxID=2961520 RepID=A0ABY5E8W5_9BACT|nr:ATP-binding protein [Arcobacter roscoffensis]UTJ07588.1 ATP-binding protein [Arcobacter roscoffensis]